MSFNNFFYNFFTYIKMSKDSLAKYHKNKEGEKMTIWS